MYQQETDHEAVWQSRSQVHQKGLGVAEYFQETDNFFKKLECKSKDIQRIYEKVTALNDITSLFNKLKDDISYTRICWETEFRAFNYFGIDVNGAFMSEENMCAQLTMAKCFVERELRKIHRNMAEDRLSLGEVERDVRRLQKYFGRVEL